MTDEEALISLSRHYEVLKKEIEVLRKIIKFYSQIIPSQHAQPIPPETLPWKNSTYRDKEGKFPNDIIDHLDWLSMHDFYLDAQWIYNKWCYYCNSIKCMLSRIEDIGRGYLKRTYICTDCQLANKHLEGLIN
jgi:hypothetical protein